MKVIHDSKRWILALVGGVCLVGAAVGMAQLEQQADVPRAANAHELSSIFREVAREALPSIVSIETEGKPIQVSRQTFPFDEDSPFGDFFKSDPRFRKFFEELPEQERPRRHGQGSGFIIDPSGIIMTNTHVVRDAEKVIVRLHDGREFVAADIKTDPRSDVAIVRIDPPEKLKAIRLGRSDMMEVGDWVLAVGSPFGLDLTVTAGIISAKGRGPRIAQREDFLQTDAAINPGNSGGPLLNLNGEVIGINTAISSRSGGNDGVGFAIPIDMARWVGEQLMETGKVQRAYLGVTIQRLSDDLAKQFKTEYGQGVVITQIMPGSPADEAKLQPGDIVLELAGQSVKSTRGLQGIVERLDIDKTYTMVILRDGQRMNIDITFRQMPENFTPTNMLGGNDAPSSPNRDEEPEGFDELGLQIKAMTPAIARQLDLKSDRGVLVSAVQPNSAASKAGLTAGVVIERVGNRQVNSPAEYREALKQVSVEEGVLLLIRTSEGTQFIVVESNP